MTPEEEARLTVALAEIRETRKCGNCFACCVYLGIPELKKWSGQACKHLDGRDPEHRCTIYEHRPRSCQSYYCAWMGGFGDDDMRPNECGVLVTLYDSDPETNVAIIEGRRVIIDTKFSATVHVIDPRTAGHLNIEGSPLQRMCIKLLAVCNDIGITLAGNAPGQPVLHLRDGKIFAGKLVKPPPGNYEELSFSFESRPIGSFRVE